MRSVIRTTVGQHFNIDTERRAGPSAIAELLVQILSHGLGRAYYTSRPIF